MKEYYYIDAKVKTEDYESLLGKISEYNINGCEEIANDENFIILRIYFLDKDVALFTKEKLKNNIFSDVAVVKTDYKEWLEKWHSSIKPVELKKGWWVSPLWCPPVLDVKSDNVQWIKIEPKMAFGTGHHESTRLAGRVIIEKKDLIMDRKILDIGTGSGILSFIAAKAGANWCVGVEIDKECIDNLLENRELNGCKEVCSFVIGPIFALKEDFKFDLIVMNVIHTEGEPLLPYCKKLVSKGGILIWSGILKEDKEDSITAALKNGFILKEEVEENEWWCGTFCNF